MVSCVDMLLTFFHFIKNFPSRCTYEWRLIPTWSCIIYIQTTPTDTMGKFHNMDFHQTLVSNMTDDWISLNDQQTFNGRNEHIHIYKKSNYKVGRNFLVNRFQPLNDKIKFSWLNESFDSFKIKCKNLFL